jgi:hypothetical protein
MRKKSQEKKRLPKGVSAKQSKLVGRKDAFSLRRHRRRIAINSNQGSFMENKKKRHASPAVESNQTNSWAGRNSSLMCKRR